MFNERGICMNLFKLFGLIIYAVGIIGGVEGVVLRGETGRMISMAAMVVIIIGSILLTWGDKKK